MNGWIAQLANAFSEYKQDIEDCEKKANPTDGLLGIGKAINDDACHDRFDAKIRKIVTAIVTEQPSAETAEQAVRLLLMRSRDQSWHLSAQWMLHAVERHSLPLIPFLKPETAKSICSEYDDYYKRWERLPAQRKVYKALKAQEKEN